MNPAKKKLLLARKPVTEGFFSQHSGKIIIFILVVILLNLVYHNDLPDIDDEDDWHASKGPSPLVELDEDNIFLLSHEKTLLIKTDSSSNGYSVLQEQQDQPEQEQPHQQQEHSQQQQHKTPSSPLKKPQQQEPTSSALLNKPTPSNVAEKETRDENDTPAPVPYDEELPYAQDNEPFLQLVDKTYSDADLYEWEPAPPVPSDPNEPGYMGKAVIVPDEKIAEAEKLFSLHEFNMVASQMISYNRTYPDLRDPKCLTIQYPRKLPQTSVIIILFNEEWSVLIRTIWSVYTKSPRALLKEIILLDDGSDHEELGLQLENYIKQIPVSVVLVRAKKRSGIVLAKLLAVRHAKAPIVTFLDAHIECNDGWLEPLLAIVAEDRTAVATPIGDFITYDTFRVYKDHKSLYGIINWAFTFNWISIPERELKRTSNDPSAIIRTPAMVGGLFAMDKEYFYKVGSYDEKMQLWGGEEIEMSIRLWTCGGSILMPQCSRVGHMGRKRRFYTDSYPGGIYKLMMANMWRYIDVWTDEYSVYFYGLNPNAQNYATDVSERKKLRKELKCKSFRWYLKNIDPESVLNVERKHLGEIENVGRKEHCLEEYGMKISLKPCYRSGGPQLFIITKLNQIQINYWCCEAGLVDMPVGLNLCRNVTKQQWIYSKQTQELRNGQNDKNCLSSGDDQLLWQRKCNGSSYQKWILSKINDIE